MAGAFRAGTWRGAEGFFRVAQDAGGFWWLVDPSGAPFFVRAVHGFRPVAAHGDGALPKDAAAQLRAWGFNSVGVSHAPGAGRDDGLPVMASVDFCRAGAPIVAPGVRLPDVFDPEWPQLAAQHAAEMCAPLADARDVLGWVTDDELDWGAATPAGRPLLLQICLSLEPSFPAYHAAWEFVLALHRGRLETLARAWGVAVPNKETIRALTRAEQGLATRGYLRDEARWTREFARRYFTTTAAAVRAADRNHLVFGCRFARPAGAAVLAECAYPAVDVALPHWHELPAPGAMPSQPVLAGDVCWADEAFLRPAAGDRSRRLTRVERMLKRARAALERIARHPAAVGYAWSRWQDEPGEQPPFAGGLVHANGAEACEHTELLAYFNARAETLRRAKPAAAETLVSPEKSIGLI